MELYHISVTASDAIIFHKGNKKKSSKNEYPFLPINYLYKNTNYALLNPIHIKQKNPGCLATGIYYRASDLLML